MNRRSFALSWGRKIFFGISWPVSALLFLIYLLSYLLPSGVESWIYFVSTSIALSGLFTSIAYFLIYYPIVSALPGYYSSRVVSILCVLLIQGGILLDGVVFSRFRFHLSPSQLEIFPDLISSGMIPFTSLLLIFISIFGFIVFMLFQGARIWKRMQKRFMNPVSSWYFVLMGSCFVISHLLFSNENFQSFGHRQTIASVFPLNYQTLLQRDLAGNKTTAFRYPLEKMNCPGNENPNIFFIIVEGLDVDDLNEEKMPFTFHLPDHGTFFSNQHFHAKNTENGLFGLLYGLPAIHRGVAEVTGPVFFDELKRRGYSFFLRSGLPELNRYGSQTMDGNYLQSFSDWLTEERSPLLTLLELQGNDYSSIDQEIQKILGVLYRKDILRESLIVLTGSHQNGDQKMPLIIAWPNRRKGEWSHRTTHYDVVPTLMQEIWSCKNSFHRFSDGKSLFLAPDEKWETYGSPSELEFFNPEDNVSLRGNWAGEIQGNPSREEKVNYLKLLRNSLRFYHR